MRLQAKLALALVPLIALPLLASGWLSWSYSGADLQRKAEQSLDTALHHVERATQDLVENANASLDLLTLAPETERYARSSNPEDRYSLFQSPLLKLFQDYRRTYPEYRMVRFLMPDGREDARAAGVLSGAIGVDSAVEAALLKQLPIPESQLLDQENNSLIFYRPIRLSLGYSDATEGPYRLRGFIALTVSLARLYAQVNELRPNLGWLFLVSNDGQILFGAGDAAAGDDALPGRVLEIATSAEAPQLEPIKIDWNGRHRLLQARPVGAGLTAVALLPADALLKPLQELALKIVAITLVSGLLLTLVLYLSLRRLVLTPLAQLRSAAQAIGAGSLTPTIDVRSSDEMGLLADDVREMGQRLSTYRKQIEDLAFNDQLTGLPNRHLIRELLQTYLQDCQAAGEPLAVLLFDLDNFKQINDNLGHASGDRLLRILAERFRTQLNVEALRGRSQLARFGGDQLLLFIGGLLDNDESARVAERILTETAKPFDLGVGHYVVTASVGVAEFPRDAHDAEGLIRCADLAMYRAKADGRNTYRFFSPDLDTKASERLLLEHRLRLAVAERAFQVYYQPLFTIAGMQIAGFEALLRWTDPELGSISPARFIPIAEHTGLIEELGDWVMREVCAQLARWAAVGLKTVPVAINISPLQLLRGSLIERLEGYLQQFQLAPSQLHVEITESVLMDISPINSARLEALAELGIALHIDDFGTGYSSINYLRRFKIDCIKIDRSFVSDMCTCDEDRALVAAMIAMAKALGMQVVAEGIETQAQRDLLYGLGCDLGQGYLFARPDGATEASRFLAR
ncbi:MAG: EAL domain-containing protein [Lamprobacter sp.]|uniref:putative bifunctional diguanylate cyclase/phosphodiesterase n=1 Tax=Lamprobacter sp. TaxID=3100796 RepID=UPI002B25D32C|nr:EAL domain-containing protein [Lamprobacter sp.]MEA3640725.1 EAL domain-containing protein [Lamprobacter sp.]